MCFPFDIYCRATSAERNLQLQWRLWTFWRLEASVGEVLIICEVISSVYLWLNSAPLSLAHTGLSSAHTAFKSCTHLLLNPAHICFPNIFNCFLVTRFNDWSLSIYIDFVIRGIYFHYLSLLYLEYITWTPTNLKSPILARCYNNFP